MAKSPNKPAQRPEQDEIEDVAEVFHMPAPAVAAASALTRLSQLVDAVQELHNEILVVVDESPDVGRELLIPLRHVETAAKLVGDVVARHEAKKG